MRVPLPRDYAQAMNRSSEPDTYEFHVRGELSDVVLSAFADLQATRHQGETVLTGHVPDQSALFGVLDQIQALGIQLVEVRRADSNRAAHTVKTGP